MDSGGLRRRRLGESPLEMIQKGPRLEGLLYQVLHYFFFAAVFRLAVFFLATFFLAAFFLAAGLRFAVFFLATFFLAAGFFFAAVFFLAAGLFFAAVFRLAAVFRFVAVFFFATTFFTPVFVGSRTLVVAVLRFCQLYNVSSAVVLDTI